MSRGGVPYVAAVLLGWWYPDLRQIVAIATVSIVFTVLGYFLSPEGGVFWVVLSNRLLAIFAIGVSAILLIGAWKASEANRIGEQRFQQVLDNAVEGVISINDRGIIQSFNRTAENIFGYGAEEVIGKNVSFLMPEPWAVRHDEFVANYLRTGEAKIIGIGREVEGKRKDGTTFPMDLSISELTAGGQTLFTGTVTDISMRKKWEQDLVTAKNEAERANKAKSEFLSSMSHELRTPLNAILGFTQLLTTDTDHPLTAQQLEATSHVLKAGDHLQALIDEILDLAAIEAGRISLDMSAQDPTPVINECSAVAGNLARQRGISYYDRTTGWSLPGIKIDATRFRQVLLNLVSNAIKYNRDQGSVTLGVEKVKGDVLRIYVTDTGRGIPSEKHDQIFAPFSRLGLENSDITGTGIGLTITKELVELMEGTIGFESTLHVGSTFWLEFPIVSGDLEAKHDDKKTDSAPPTVANMIGAQGGRTVLCVEDDPSSLKLLESIVKRIPGAEVITAHTGELGVDLAEIHRPDAIVMDINLPGMSGIEALKRLKKSDVTAAIPVIALTARASAKDKHDGLGVGFTKYLTKPIKVDEVSAAIISAFREA